MNRPTIVEIDFKSLDFNLKKLKNKINSSKFFPVVKADAYGHGVKEISQFLKNKVDGFCVATSEEALNLRMFSKKPILDLEGPYDLEDMKSLIENDIQFVIHSERQLSFFQKIKKLDTRYPIWLKFSGGKGVATGLGIIAMLSPISGFLFIITWIIIAFLFKYSSLSALLAFFVSSISSFFVERSDISLAILFMTLITFFRHKENIKRLVSGTESKILEGS